MNSINPALALQVITYVYGQDISRLDPPTLMSAIKKANSEIADLKSVSNKSTYIDEQVKSLTAAIKLMTDRLDTFASKAAD